GRLRDVEQVGGPGAGGGVQRIGHGPPVALRGIARARDAGDLHGERRRVLVPEREETQRVPHADALRGSGVDADQRKHGTAGAAWQGGGQDALDHRDVIGQVGAEDEVRARPPLVLQVGRASRRRGVERRGRRRPHLRAAGAVQRRRHQRVLPRAQPLVGDGGDGDVALGDAHVEGGRRLLREREAQAEVADGVGVDGGGGEDRRRGQRAGHHAREQPPVAEHAAEGEHGERTESDHAAAFYGPRGRRACAPRGGSGSRGYTAGVSPEIASPSRPARRQRPAPPAADGEPQPLLVILDSHGIIFRSYFALRDVLTVRRTGEPVAAVFGYANSILTVFDELKPSHVIAAWDATEETFRKERDVRYKAQRPAVPEDLVPQFDRVRQLLAAFHIPLVEKPGYEADDVLGTLAQQAVEQGLAVVIVTLDNDMIQLVQPGVRVYMYRPYQRDYVMYDTEAVRERFGFEPAQMIEYKALVGDTSDNIPGVKGIGEKGAKALLERYATLDEMIAHVDEIEPKRLRNALAEGVDDAQLSRELATIVREVPGVTLDLDAAVLKDYDRQRVVELFHELEFRSLITRLPESSRPASPETASAAAPDGRYEVVTAAGRLDEIVQSIRASGRFAFAVVADDPHPIRAADTLVGIAVSAEPGHAAYIPFGHVAHGQGRLLGDGGGEETAAPPAQLAPEAALGALAPVFTDPAIRRVAHDGKFALLALAESPAHLWPASIDFDTQVAAYLLGDASISLQRMAFGRLGVETMDAKSFLGTASKAIRFSQASIEDVGRYAAIDAEVTLRAAGVLQRELEANALDRVFREIDLPHVPVLARMEQFGVALDASVLAGLDDVLMARIAEAEQAVTGAVGHEIKIGSPQELSSLLFDELGLPKTRKTKTGYTTDADALEPLRALHPVVNAILSWRELTKIKSTYVDTLPQQVNPRTGRVHSVFSQVTAATGRLASNDPNLQNIPVRTEIGNLVRRAFVARDCGEDPLLLSADYSQIELRVLAHISADEGLRRAFAERKDIHTATAARVFKKAEAAVTGEDRRRAKVFNFGVLYGLTAFGLSTREGIPRDEAEAFITAYFEAYPRVQEWRERTVAEARARGYAETLTGRRRSIPDLRAGNHNLRQAAERIAINMPIQGTASDIIKIAMNRIDAELLARRARGALARLVLQVHDELIFELPRAELDEVREIAQRLMPALELAVPLVIDEKVGKTWGDLESNVER
ncbi:MAG: DNA polymerase I, partial [Dehalococcoidia bacterium]|nr:DNA polymerase I [Dehalococcoidia bacterium]